MTAVKAVFATFLVLFALTNCSGSQKKEPEAPKKSPIRILGEVTSVHQKQEFILFKRYGTSDIPELGMFSARSVDGRRAVGLVPTGEQLGRYYAADYAKDAELPRVGDLVVISTLDSQPGISAAEPSSKKSDSSPLPEIL